MSHDRSFSVNPSDYQLLEEVGYGATATVYRANFLPLNQLVAIKSLDLDRCTINLDDIRRETQTMSLIDHPNVVRAFCSFTVDHSLWVVMPFMNEGSCLHLMKSAYPDGFEEDVIGSILKETLKALEYLHQQGHIHRDVKAGNILLDSSGTIKLGDFGVSTCMFDSCDRQRSRNTFVGTPCWMAPEVLQPGSGYNSKADIWSFGITALELAHGHAPFSKYPPMKVLLMTIQNAPPGLDYDRDKKFSKSFKEMVAMCLVKDQTKRPSAEKLLKHSFFKNAKPPELSVKKLFANLPPLWNRVKSLQLNDLAQLALKRMPSSEQEAISQSEYHRGVSAWNFDVDDLKAQALLLRDDDDIVDIREEEYKIDVTDSQSGAGIENSPKDDITSCVDGSDTKHIEQSEYANKKKILESDTREPGLPNNFIWNRNGSIAEATSTIEKDAGLSKIITQSAKSRETQSGPLVPGAVLSRSSTERGRTFESTSRLENGNQLPSEKNNRQVRRAPSFSGPLMLPTRASANSLSAPIKSSGGFRDSMDDKFKANLVQIKGRFSVTSENLDLVKGPAIRKSASVCDWMSDSKQMIGQAPTSTTTNNISGSLLLPHLQNLFQQTSIQQDLIMNLLNSLQQDEANDVSQNGKLPPLPNGSEDNGSVETAATERERVLQAKVSELEARMINLREELDAEKLKTIQLQQQLNIEEQNGDIREEIA